MFWTCLTHFDVHDALKPQTANPNYITTKLKWF